VRQDLRAPLAALALAFVVATAATIPGAIRSGNARPVPQADPQHPRLKYGDSLVSINDRCAVKEGPLSAAVRPIYVNKMPVGFCCTTCPPVFMMGPEPYLERMKASFMDPVDPKRPARIAAALRYHVNWEIFYFATRATMDAFRKDPLAYCGWLTDPVNGVRFRPTARSPRFLHAGRWYYFTSDSTRVEFQANPIDYSIRKGA
jgi:YHS domain-containing protein